MKITLCNRTPRFALWTGVIVALFAFLAIGFAFTLNAGSGSLYRWGSPGLFDHMFTAILSLPLSAGVGLIAALISRLIGGAIVASISILGLSYLVLYAAESSTPEVQLARLTGKTNIPEVQIVHFRKGNTFSDGTSYAWIALCSPTQAAALSNALGMKPVVVTLTPEGKIQTTVENLPFLDLCHACEIEADGYEFYMGDLGVVGGYSHDEKKFCIYWWPSVH